MTQLDERAAYLLRKPIRHPQEMPTPIKTRPIDKEWDETIKDRWWYRANCERENTRVDPQMFDLREKLLSFGGHNACLPVFEEDLKNILERGQLWYGDRTHMMKGQPSQCHRNSSYCWDANKDKTVLCTGYALSEDGMWRQRASRS